MARPAHAIIDLDAIRHNYRLAKATAPNSRAIAILKANAYGHGAIAVGQALAPEADAFGVACSEEALELREAGIKTPILLLEGVFEECEMLLVDEHRLSIAVSTQQQLDWLLNAKLNQPINAFLKVDSGMHRLGFSLEAAPAAYELLSNAPQVNELVLMTHLSHADDPVALITNTQLDRFNNVITGLSNGTSAANSAAVLAHTSSHGQFIRPGIMLYGSTPLGDEHESRQQLKPSMSLRSAIFSIRDIAAGETIGYGGRYLCEKPTRVGVVAIGYADGYPRHAADGTPISIDGHPSQIIGRVSMDMLTVDLTHLPHIKEGAPVELWGSDVTANSVAINSSTIAYTLFTGITRRVPLHYINR
ncbi:alanine racemase [Leucothrix arctica]|uniref:Alanine racemase n=1 Tax=Leucothrix arctica TaxID=1481894 RepID=A0A317C840_9GAMM|nr:alanine racemase [Leucothrix arctica]PWQ94477.1 alanine racemase [Leucothrix arctica]